MSTITTDEQLCNQALGHLGEKLAVTEITAGTTDEEVQCRSYYTTVLRAVLSAMDWKFASRTILLEELAAGGEPAVGDPGEEAVNWEYKYSLPADCIEPREIWSGERAPAPEDRIPFEPLYFIPGDGEAGSPDTYLGCDIEPATDAPYLRYTADISTPASWPAPFVLAFGWALAAELAMPLTAKPELDAFCRQGYRAALAAAKGSVLRGRQGDLEPDDFLLAARR